MECGPSVGKYILFYFNQKKTLNMEQATIYIYSFSRGYLKPTTFCHKIVYHNIV